MIDASPYLVPPADLADLPDADLPSAAVARMWTQVDIYDDTPTYLAGLRPATPGQVAVFAVVWFDSEVCNGGFHQFFYNPTGIVAREAALGFRRLNAQPCAELLVKAMARFPGGIAPRDREQRITLLERTPYSEWKNFFGPLEDAYYAMQDTADNLESVCSRYIRAHLSEFVRPSAKIEEAPAALPSARRVLHARFGAGTVIASHEDATKLDIAFDDGVTRTLLSRFVTDL